MEYAACNVVYVDRTAREDRLVTRGSTNRTEPEHSPSHIESSATAHASQDAVDDNLRTLLGTFSEGWSRASSQVVEKANSMVECMCVPLADHVSPNYLN